MNLSQNHGYDKRPRILDLDPKYRTLSPSAKELYTKLYNRACLSATKGDQYRDEHGVYIIYTVEEACSCLNCGRDKAIKTFKELVSVGLIWRRRQGYSNPYRIYVTDLLGQIAKSTSIPPNNPTDNERNHQPITVGETVRSNNIGINNDINQSTSSQDWDEVEKTIKNNIEYNILATEIPVALLDKILRVLVSKCCCNQPYLRIAGTNIPTAKVRAELLALNDIHIRFVCDKLTGMSAEVKNIDAICLHLLWHAASDMEIESQIAVNRDFAAGKIITT